MRVLFATSDKFPPFRPAAKVLFGKVLPERGYEIDWLIQQDDNHNTAATDIETGQLFLASTIRGNTRLSRAMKYVADGLNDMRMLWLCRGRRYDILQVKDKYFAGIVAAITSWLTRTPFCYWLAYPHAEADLYSADEGVARYPFLYRVRGHFRKFALYRIILPAADHVFVQSQQMKEDIAAHGIDLDKMTPVPSSVSLEKYPTRDIQPDTEQPRVVYFGTLQRERQLDFMIRAFAKVLERFPTAKLDVIGKGQTPEDDALIDEAIRSTQTQASVVLHGFMAPKDANILIQEALVCLSPYFCTEILLSTSPTKLVEYLALGRAVAATEHPEQAEVLAACHAGLTAPWDEDAYADAICQILADPDEAMAMGARGRDYVTQHRTDAVLADVVESGFEKARRLPKDVADGEQTDV